MSFDHDMCVCVFNVCVVSLGGSMVIDTATIGSVTTSMVCLNNPLTIYGMDFGIGLACLPLSQLDVILGIN